MGAQYFVCRDRCRAHVARPVTHTPKSFHFKEKAGPMIQAGLLRSTSTDARKVYSAFTSSWLSTLVTPKTPLAAVSIRVFSASLFTVPLSVTTPFAAVTCTAGAALASV